MTRILIGNKNIQEALKDFEFLKNSNEYEIITSNSGVETINKCKTINPAIIILDSNFSDIPYTEVIDKISALPNEQNRCNLILNVENPKDKILLHNTSIVYKIFEIPFNEKEELETIKILRTKFEMPSLSLRELKNILLSLGINTYSLGSQYLISAIFKCYYETDEFTTLAKIYEIIAHEFGVSKEQVKNSIRHIIEAFNNSYHTTSNKLCSSIFTYTTDISPKIFIERFVNYLHIIKSKD